MMANWWQHLTTTPFSLGRAFPNATLLSINDAVRASESRHSAEIRVAVETAFNLRQLWSGITPRERAVDVFSLLRVWDTAGNNGVLIYILLAVQDIEIVADRAFAESVPAAELAAVCATLQADFAAGEFRAGTLKAIARLTELAEPHFPPGDRNPDELANSPVLL